MRFLPQLVWALLLFAGPGLTWAQTVDAGFIRLFSPGSATPLTGSSPDPQFPGTRGWIAISALSDGTTNSVATTIGIYPGRTGFTALSFRKPVDAVSPVLLQKCAAGLPFSAEFALRPAGIPGNFQAPLYHATLSNAAIQTLAWVMDATNELQESVTLQYARIDWNVTSFSASGVPTTILRVNWDQVSSSGSNPGSLAVPPPSLGYPASIIVAPGASRSIPPSQLSISGTLDHVAVADTGGYTGGLSVNALTGELTLTNAQPPGGPYLIWVEAVDANFLATKTSLSLIVSPPPVANPDLVTRIYGQTNQFPLARLLANDTPGVSFVGLPATNTALAGIVSVSGDTITYLPPVPDPGGNDSFTYQIQDQYGQTALGTVSVGIALPGGGSIGNLTIQVTDQGTSIALVGLPGRNYHLQSTSDLGGVWMNVGNPVSASAANGLARWPGLPNSATTFYRAFLLP